MKEKRFLRYGFRSKNQLPLFMIWWEWRIAPYTPWDVTYAQVIFCIN